MSTIVEAKAVAKKAPPLKRSRSPFEITIPFGRGARCRQCSGSFFSPSNSIQFAQDATPRASESCSRAIPSWKRALDVSSVLISLPITLPLMAAVMLWIKFVSRGPTLFRQERIGRNGKSFTLYKFRSMKLNADTRRHEFHFRQLVRSNCPMVKLDLLCDSRLIPGGCFLRAAALDELPQLFNVLCGEMSLVGPRPCLPEEFRFFSPKQRERFEVLPGLTGMWQVMGMGMGTFSEMNEMDAQYARQSSLSLDLDIMLRTPNTLLRQMCQAFQQHVAAGKPDVNDAEEYPVENYSGHRPS